MVRATTKRKASVKKEDLVDKDNNEVMEIKENEVNDVLDVKENKKKKAVSSRKVKKEKKAEDTVDIENIKTEEDFKKGNVVESEICDNSKTISGKLEESIKNNSVENDSSNCIERQKIAEKKIDEEKKSSKKKIAKKSKDINVADKSKKDNQKIEKVIEQSSFNSNEEECNNILLTALNTDSPLELIEFFKSNIKKEIFISCLSVDHKIKYLDFLIQLLRGRYDVISQVKELLLLSEDLLRNEKFCEKVDECCQILKKHTISYNKLVYLEGKMEYLQKKKKHPNIPEKIIEK